MPRPTGILVGSIALLAACGTAADGIAVEDPPPTIFPTESANGSSTSAPAESTTTTTTTTTLPLSDRLPILDLDRPPRALITPTDVVVPVVGTTEDGWIVQTPCAEQAEVTSGTPVSDVHVVIDPGHGGSETGAVGEAGTLESDLNLRISRLVEAELDRLGVEVLLTRHTDIRSALATRALIATSLEVDAFVSIHHNADPDGRSEQPGSEMWYQIDDPESRRLSGLIYEEVLATLSTHEVAWVADTDAGVKYRLNQRGTDYYGILRNATGVPASLAELAFLTNPEEEALVNRPEVQMDLAVAVATGIVRFLGSDDSGSGFVEPYDRVEPAGPGGGTAGCEDPLLE